MKKKQGQQIEKLTYVAGITPIILEITLNVNSLNSPIKRSS
jgi:hypothetical protein